MPALSLRSNHRLNTSGTLQVLATIVSLTFVIPFFATACSNESGRSERGGAHVESWRQPSGRTAMEDPVPQQLTVAIPATTTPTPDGGDSTVRHAPLRLPPTPGVTATALASLIQSAPSYPPHLLASAVSRYTIAGQGGLNAVTYGNGGAPQSIGVLLPVGVPMALPATGLPARRVGQDAEGYASIDDNPFLAVEDAPLSTFAIDVDTASYSNMRRFIENGALPPPDAIRIEEFVNYFEYDDPPPIGDEPFAVSIDHADAPWTPGHSILRIGLKGRPIDLAGRPTSNLVFLLDVSGSMAAENKLPLVKKAMRLLVEGLGENDRVSMVTYAGASGLVLPPTSAADQATILEALERLKPGGSTAGAAGIQQAYDVAEGEFIEGGNNRVILATDGDFNVGISDPVELEALITERARRGIFLTVLGFGMGNLKDDRLELLADHGDGNYAYIDSLFEANKVLVEEIGGTLYTIAKDVKVQLELNPARVAGYRLIGYENRLLAPEDFNDDTKDAGEIGAGHSLTVLYELVPAGMPFEPGRAAELPDAGGDEDVDPLRYDPQTGEAADSDELLTVKLRYKAPEGGASTKFDMPFSEIPAPIEAASDDMRFAAAVAAFGMLLRKSPHAGLATFEAVIELAEAGIGADERGYRARFVELVRSARMLADPSSDPHPATDDTSDAGATQDAPDSTDP